MTSMDYWDGKTGGNKWMNRQSEEEYLILQYKGEGLWEMLKDEQQQFLNTKERKRYKNENSDSIGKCMAVGDF